MSEDQFDKNQALFLGLIQSLSANVWIQLGKQKNPVTDKLERNLDEAAFSIDLLEMLQAKTKNNLNPDEARILERTISELKMNYVDEKIKAEKEEKAKQPEERPEEKSQKAEPTPSASEPREGTQKAKKEAPKKKKSKK